MTSNKNKTGQKQKKYFMFFYILLTVTIFPLSVIHARTWEYHLEKGTLQFRAEMYDYAMENLLMCLEKKPDAFKAANLIAEIYLIKNKKRDALKYFEISLKINHSQSQVLNSSGELLEFFAYNAKAFERYRKAVETDPANHSAHLNLVRFYLKQGKKNKAEEHFSRARQLKLAESLPLYKKAMEADLRGDHKEAINLYKKAVKANPAMTEAWMNLSVTLRKKSNYTEAAATLETLKKIKPDHADAYLHLGHIYFNHKLSGSRKYFIDLSIKNLKKAAILSSFNRDIYVKLSEIYYAIGDDINGKLYEQKALKKSQK